MTPAGNITASDQALWLEVGLISDTHGVWDEGVADHFQGVAAIVHAGDIGHHGGAAAVLERLGAIAPVTAVRGNVDEEEGAAYPESATLHLNGWELLVTHILGMPPQVTPAGAALLAQHKPDIVVFGHSHVYGVTQEQGPQGPLLYINPGSAGPARFRLGRSVARLLLPPKGSGELPEVQKIELAAKAPPRLSSVSGRKRRRKS